MALSIVILGENSFKYLQQLIMKALKYNLENKYECENIIYYSVICESPYHYLYNIYLQKADIIIIPTKNSSYLYSPMIQIYGKKNHEILKDDIDIAEMREIIAMKSIELSKRSKWRCCC